jgi:hypothetical protein
METDNILRALEQGKLNDARGGINEILLGKVADSLEEKRQSIGDTLVTPTDVHEGDKAEYEAFFRKALKKFGVESPADFDSDEEKKKFFDYIEKNYTGEKNEEVEDDDENEDELDEIAGAAIRVGTKIAKKGGRKVAKAAVGAHRVAKAGPRAAVGVSVAKRMRKP